MFTLIRRIFSCLRSHSKDAPARKTDFINNQIISQNDYKKDILVFLLDKGILYTDSQDWLYKLNTAKLSTYSIKWQDVSGVHKEGSITQPDDVANGGSSAGNGTGASYDFDIKSFSDTSQCISSRAYLIAIQKLENHALLSDKLSPEYTSAKASIGEDLTQVAFSSAYEYLTKYPACFSSAALTSGMIGYGKII